MRIWDLPVTKLCDKHLLGEHRELHCIWTFLTTDKGGSYKKHPETLRWEGRLAGLFIRHEQQVEEMKNRGWKHKSDLDKRKFGILPSFEETKPKPYQTLEEQIEVIKNKGCKCAV